MCSPDSQWFGVPTSPGWDFYRCETGARGVGIGTATAPGRAARGGIGAGKGLGEMDGEELWNTTLDPARRTLVRVQFEDDDMFRTLTGEKVEPAAISSRSTEGDRLSRSVRRISVPWSIP
jgi:hypothetical protein